MSGDHHVHCHIHHHCQQ
uniref:Translation initiation factor eIF-2B beta subunit n=1 Tax=Arundo donax TaxID=35708 RepID=A0A0A9FLF8_ARUDO